jgi:hypothetical protein
MKRGLWGWQLAVAVLAVGFVTVFACVPSAFADNIVIQNNTGCASGINGICVGGITPFSVTDVENGTETLLEPGLSPAATVGDSTVPTYILVNDTGSTTFTLTFSGTLANNAFLDCQENGGFAGDLCSISGSLGTVSNNGQYGPPAGQMTPWNPNVTITFSGVPVGTQFDLSFTSFAHANTDTGTVTGSAMPEPSAGLMLGTGLLGLIVISIWGRVRSA